MQLDVDVSRTCQCLYFYKFTDIATSTFLGKTIILQVKHVLHHRDLEL